MSDFRPADDITGAGAGLDELIGDIRREAARRRAAPDFPVEPEARLSATMDAEGPRGPGADLAGVAAALGLAAGSDPAGRVAGLAASAVLALSARLGHLERRMAGAGRSAAVGGGSLAVGGPGAGGSWGPGGSSGVGGPAPDLIGWLENWGTVPGTILVAGSAAGPWVERLGAMAYGVDPAAEPMTQAGAVRSGPVLEHLRSVGDASLAMVVLAGAVESSAGPAVDDWAAELVRVTGAVRICAEAPWAWRLRVGDGAADRAAVRPLAADTWLEALDGAGWAVAGRYGAGGRQYGIEADRQP